LDRFDALISKIIFKNKKNIILMHFDIKNTLKNNCNHTPKHACLSSWRGSIVSGPAIWRRWDP
jgi:hypothetical protein